MTASVSLDPSASPPGGGAIRVLLAEDDPGVQDVVRRSLSRHGMLVDVVSQGTAVVDAVTSGGYDVVVLDLSLPGLDGFDILEALPGDVRVPIIILSGRAGEGDRVLGLELGADDYVVKPFSHRELVARIHTVLRRSRRRVGETEVGGDGLLLDLDSREATLEGTELDLTLKEFDLLAYLARDPRRVISKEELLREVWRSKPEWQDLATVTEHVRRIRRKLHEVDAGREWITTVRGVGYRFEPS